MGFHDGHIKKKKDPIPCYIAYSMVIGQNGFAVITTS